jgi:hypothetical protein
MVTTRPRVRFPSPALILSCLALLAALGGGAYAAASTGTPRVRWTKAKLMNGWQTHLGATAPAGYAKDSAGVVHLRGTMHNGTDDTTAFVLPKRMRPRHITVLTLFTSTPGGELEISSDGTVLPIGGGDTTYTSLDGISFVAGQ